MNELIDVEEKEFVKSYTITKADIRVTNIKLFESITLTVIMRDSEGNLVDVKNVTVDGEDYNQWSTDDDYIVSITLEKCGLKIKPIENIIP